jgi:riboflavin kinase
MAEVEPEEREVLKILARRGGLHDFVHTSSGEVAEDLDVSQQTASRKILDLLERDLIERKMGARKQFIRLSPEGSAALEREYGLYRSIFEKEDTVEIAGSVVSGLGEGEYYITREGYRKAFNRLFGFDPYPGTLNLEVPSSDRQKLRMLQATDGMRIDEFESEGRTFGAVKCFEATLDDVEAGAILPVRSHHSNTLEIISPHHLRDELGLEDGDEVTATVVLDPEPASEG